MRTRSGAVAGPNSAAAVAADKAATSPDKASHMGVAAATMALLEKAKLAFNAYDRNRWERREF